MYRRIKNRFTVALSLHRVSAARYMSAAVFATTSISSYHWYVRNTLRA